jgi:hypothetical protein
VERKHVVVDVVLPNPSVSSASPSIEGTMTARKPPTSTQSRRRFLSAYGVRGHYGADDVADETGSEAHLILEKRPQRPAAAAAVSDLIVCK